MEGWRRKLRFDPLPQLLSSENEALLYFTRRDLLGEKAGPIETLWQLPLVLKMISKQRGDGLWRYPGGKEHIRSDIAMISLKLTKFWANL